MSKMKMPRTETVTITTIDGPVVPNALDKHSATEVLGSALDILGFKWHEDPSTHRTPERFINYLMEFMQPYRLHDIIGTGFEHNSDDEVSIHGLVLQTYIPYVAICEHHLLPFYGEAFIGYVPNSRVIGLSKMARLVHAVGHERPGLQEAHTEMIADAMFKALNSKGSMCVIRATHTCMSCRGITAIGAKTTTSCIRGIFRDVPAVRDEFLSLAGLHHA